MLPAGQYLVTSDSNGVFRNRRPASGHDPAGTKPALTFRRFETQYPLATIWTSGSEGFAIAGR
jgi:hypothetical protein